MISSPGWSSTEGGVIGSRYNEERLRGGGGGGKGNMASERKLGK